MNSADPSGANDAYTDSIHLLDPIISVPQRFGYLLQHQVFFSFQPGDLCRRFRKHEIPNQFFQVVTSRDELTQRSYRGRKSIEFSH